MICDELSEEEKDQTLADLLDSFFDLVQEYVMVHLIEIIEDHFLVLFLRLLDALGSEMRNDFLVLDVEFLLGSFEDIFYFFIDSDFDLFGE